MLVISAMLDACMHDHPKNQRKNCSSKFQTSNVEDFFRWKFKQKIRGRPRGKLEEDLIQYVLLPLNERGDEGENICSQTQLMAISDSWRKEKRFINGLFEELVRYFDESENSNLKPKTKQMKQ